MIKKHKSSISQTKDQTLNVHFQSRDSTLWIINGNRCFLNSIVREIKLSEKKIEIASISRHQTKKLQWTRCWDRVGCSLATLHYNRLDSRSSRVSRTRKFLRSLDSFSSRKETRRKKWEAWKDQLRTGRIIENTRHANGDLVTERI